MKLFAQGPDISDAEDEDSDVNQAKEGPPETVDAKRLKRREKKRKANAKKLAKKYAALGVEPPAPGPAPTKKQRKAEAESKPIAAGKPGTVASKGAQKGAGKGHESESSDWPSSSDEEDEPERTKQTTKPAVAPPKSFFDPFAKKRIAAAPAAVEKLTNCRNLTAPNKTKPVSENGGDSSSTSSSSSDSESSEEPAKPAKAAAPQSFFDPFSKKRIVVGQGGGGGGGGGSLYKSIHVKVGQLMPRMMPVRREMKSKSPKLLRNVPQRIVSQNHLRVKMMLLSNRRSPLPLQLDLRPSMTHFQRSGLWCSLRRRARKRRKAVRN